MKIAVIGSTGRVGSRIMNEGTLRGHEMTGISRNETTGIKKNLFELTSNDLKDFDVVVSAFGVWDDQSLHLKAAKHLDSIMSSLNNRWIAVGGAGSLYVASDLMLKDSDGFPEEYKGVANGMYEGLDFLKKEAISNWSYFSPAAIFEPGDKTGAYKLGLEELLTDSNGKSYISMEDYALAMIDVIEQNLYQKTRFSAVQA